MPIWKYHANICKVAFTLFVSKCPFVKIVGNGLPNMSVCKYHFISSFMQILLPYWKICSISNLLPVLQLGSWNRNGFLSLILSMTYLQIFRCLLHLSLACAQNRLAPIFRSQANDRSNNLPFESSELYFIIQFTIANIFIFFLKKYTFIIKKTSLIVAKTITMVLYKNEPII